MDGTIHLDDIAVFARVADAASFRHAAEALGIPRSSVSRRIEGLEKHLGVRLLRRTTRSVTLTQAGDAYLRACRPALEALADADRAITATTQGARSLMRITASVAFGEQRLGALIDEFLRAHDRVELEVVLVDRHVDVIQEGFDFAFRAGGVGDASLVARELARGPVVCVASAGYLDGHPRLTQPKDLAHHRCIVYPPLAPKGKWSFRVSRRTVNIAVRGRIIVSSLPLALEMAVRGLGVARVPRPIAENALRSGSVVEVLGAHVAPDTPFHVVYPVGSQTMPHRRAFLDLVLKRLRPL